MTLKISWNEFKAAALLELQRKYPNLGEPSFFQKYGYEPDGECYNFPPAYVEFQLLEPKGGGE